MTDVCGQELPVTGAYADRNQLILQGDFAEGCRVQFAMTPYYEVNLYNCMKNPVKPFEIKVK